MVLSRSLVDRHTIDEQFAAEQIKLHTPNHALEASCLCHDPVVGLI